MARLIIEYPDTMQPESALWRVMRVVQQGRISDGGSLFCYATTFQDGTRVYTRRKPRGQTTDSFLIHHPAHKKEPVNGEPVPETQGSVDQLQQVRPVQEAE